jgi:hypothetical protein
LGRRIGEEGQLFMKLQLETLQDAKGAWIGTSRVAFFGPCQILQLPKRRSIQECSSYRGLVLRRRCSQGEGEETATLGAPFEQKWTFPAWTANKHFVPTHRKKK